MKYANSKEELSKIISEIMNNTKENRYFMHNTTVGEKFYDLIDEGEGILTEKEAKEKNMI